MLNIFINYVCKWIPGEWALIFRVISGILFAANKGQLPESSVTKIIYGIFGMIRLIAGACAAFYKSISWLSFQLHIFYQPVYRDLFIWLLNSQTNPFVRNEWIRILQIVGIHANVSFFYWYFDVLYKLCINYACIT